MFKPSTNLVCNNCGKQGHLFHQCKLPITSYGLIAFRPNRDGAFEYLMIRRKNSFGFIDFVRGKYSPYHLHQLKTMVDQMSLEEKENIQTQSFETLWTNMWGEHISTHQYKNEEIASKKKFDMLKEGVLIDNVLYTISDLVALSPTSWTETEWEFPKGRRNPKEKDVECALREFEEETGIPVSSIQLVENVLPFEEMYIGTNHKAYKHKYFLGFSPTVEDTCRHQFQECEVSKLEWKTLDQCIASIRPYNLEKKEIIQNINKVLQEYRLYC